MTPKLRKVQRHAPLYPLNKFPKGFGMKLGKELVYLLATRDAPDISGDDWEKIFARCIGVSWKKSNEGIEDVVMGGGYPGARRRLRTQNPLRMNTYA